MSDHGGVRANTGLMIVEGVATDRMVESVQGIASLRAQVANEIATTMSGLEESEHVRFIISIVALQS